MRVRRGLLFWGLALIPLGAIPLLVRAGAIPADTLVDAWRWWPLLLIGGGLALILGRHSAGLVGTAVVGLGLGIIAGGAVASDGAWVGAFATCGAPGGETTTHDETGTFDAPATVTIDLDCGTMELATEPGTAWSLHAEHRGALPVVEATGASLTVRAPDGGGLRRQDWTVTVGDDALRDLSIRMNAGSATASLGDAAVAGVGIDVNAGDLRLDAAAATVERLDASVNAGRMRVTLGSGETRGDLSVNAGAIDLCVPPDAALRFEVEQQFTFATNLEAQGLTQDGDTWSRPGDGGTIALDIDGNAATLTLDPDGGCA